MNKEEFIAAIRKAELVDDWYCDIIKALGNTFAGGYMAATVNRYNGHMEFNSEEFREILLDRASWGIWK